MNREQRRKQLKEQGKKFKGIDVVDGIIQIPILGSKETLELNTNDFGIYENLMSIVDTFSNIDTVYAKDIKRIDNIEDDIKRAKETIALYSNIIRDFRDNVNNLFNDDRATMKIFRCNLPTPEAIAEFLDSLQPIIQSFNVMADSTPNFKYTVKEGDE